VIDDSPSSCLLLSVLLRPLGLKVLTARDGETGLALAREHRPAIVFLDLVLPTLSGLEVCEHLRRNPATAGVLVVIVSGGPLPEDRSVFDQLGVRAYLTKPLDPKQFSDSVRAVLREDRAAEGS
jgi:DNA-binding response OmpR family regulator